MDAGSRAFQLSPSTPASASVADSTESKPMDAFVIQGGRPLAGRVEISGAKNAALPVMAATLLTARRPHPAQRAGAVGHAHHGARARAARRARRVPRPDLQDRHLGGELVEAPYELVRTMRASIYVLAPLLARFGAARVTLPGGCAWGPRPVNLHIEGLNAMGAKLEIDHGYIVGKDVRLRGATYNFEIVSVGATAQLMMAATLAEGETVLDNAALEPHITALADVLVQCGADIGGIGTRRMTVRGVKNLQPIDTTIIPPPPNP